MAVYKNRFPSSHDGLVALLLTLICPSKSLKKEILLYKKKMILEIIKQKNRELLLIFPKLFSCILKNLISILLFTTKSIINFYKIF